MKTLTNLLLIAQVLIIQGNIAEFKQGLAPWCLMDNVDNLSCYYYDLASCQEAQTRQYGASSCVRNSN